ncbi:MAG: M48 family metallopeptidase [Armatimonadetes bacterium]|nr:M48 family metallopeptidase [Armatimonadota bacterium]
MRTVVEEEREFGGSTVPFLVREVPRARRISIRVTHEGVVVTKPRRTPQYEVEEFLAASENWILERLAEHEEKVVATLNDRVPYLGAERTIRQASTPPVRLAGDEFWAMGETRDERMANVVAWMRRRSKPVIRDAVARWSSEMGIAVKRVSVRDQRARWGSCSDRGSLSFNWRLIMTPPEVLEYIVVHEMAHIQEHNHSRRFWTLVERFCQEFTVHEGWLDENGDRLMAVGR